MSRFSDTTKHLAGLFAFLLVSCMLMACQKQQQPFLSQTYLSYNNPNFTDLTDVSQNLYEYLDITTAEELLMSKEEQQELAKKYKTRFFASWLQKNFSHTIKNINPWGAHSVEKPSAWAENLLPWTEKSWKGLINNANMEHFPYLTGVAQKNNGMGILVQNSSLRMLPTQRPLFYNPAQAGEGFPFDMNQNSAIWFGSPVRVGHMSRDGAWLYCEAAYAGGWVPASHVAFVDAKQVEWYQTLKPYIVLADNVGLYTRNKEFLARVHMGTMLFSHYIQNAHTKDLLEQYLVPQRDVNGQAYFVPVSPDAERQALREESLQASSATQLPQWADWNNDLPAIAPFPIEYTTKNIAILGNRVMGTPYGWGGLYENRDCSSTLKDIFAGFGIWLARNSKIQSLMFKHISVEGIPLEKKEAEIVKIAKPWQSFIWMPGHIGLYVGTVDNRPVMFHSSWGLRTEVNGERGRFVLGGTVVTTLTPARKVPEVSTFNMLERIGVITMIGIPRDEKKDENKNEK